MELLSAFPPLLSACGQPAYTNYVGGFHGCLDYIFIQPDSMQVPAVVFRLSSMGLWCTMAVACEIYLANLFLKATNKS